MSGIARLLAKQLNSALGIVDDPKYNKMFKETDEVLSDVADPDDPTVARFYSPLETALEQAPIGKAGTRGENVEAFVRKRAPKVSKAEMEFRGLQLTPEDPYTADTAKQSLRDLEVKAVRQGNQNYRMSQRQSDLEDSDVGYVELSLNASEDLGLTTHMGKSSLAHTRYSFRQNRDGKLMDNGFPNIRFDEDPDYILIEELQSDPLQNAVDDFSKYSKEVENDFTKQIEGALKPLYDTSDFIGEDIKPMISKYKDYLYKTIVPTFKRREELKTRKDIFKEAYKNFDLKEINIGANGSAGSVLGAFFDKKFDYQIPYDLEDELFDVSLRIEKAVDDLGGKFYRTVDKKDLPVQRITDTVRMSLQAIIADAKGKGVNEIVLPPVEKLAEKRFAKSEVASKVAKGSAFYNTYVTAYNKALKQLKAELGDQITIGTKELKYRSDDYQTMDPKYDIKQGTLLDITNLTIDPKNIKLRFNEGGLVERRK